MKIYYAHPIWTYGTKQEQRDLDLLKNIFPNGEIINPNSKENEELYKLQGMELFTNLVDSCDIVVFRACPGGKIPAGIWKEINRNKILIELPSLLDREMSVENTRNFIKEIGYR